MGLLVGNIPNRNSWFSINDILFMIEGGPDLILYLPCVPVLDAWNLQIEQERSKNKLL